MDFNEFDWKVHHMSECGFTWHRPTEAPKFELRVRQKYDHTQASTIFYRDSNLTTSDLLSVEPLLVPYVSQFLALPAKLEVEIVDL
jgi:hypothetical protein